MNTPMTCAGKVYCKRFRMDIGCDQPATVERDGKAYCPGCDPQGTYVTQRDDFYRAAAVAAAKHRATATERLHDAEIEGAAAIDGHVFPYRDALYAHLCTSAKEAKGRPLAGSELPLLQAVAIGLWSNHAREHGIDVRMISCAQYEQVTRARALKARATAVASR